MKQTPRKTKMTLLVGDRVRIKAMFGPGGKPGEMCGTVRKVTPLPHLRAGARGAGGNLGYAQVEWDNDHVARVEERKLEVLIRNYYPRRLEGHKLTLEWCGEYGVESSSTASCICGWEESASNQKECRWEYRCHLKDEFEKIEWASYNGVNVPAYLEYLVPYDSAHDEVKNG